MAESNAQDRFSMKFERRSRLTTRAEYSRVFSRPRVDQDRLFRILSQANDLDHGRLGMAVSIKVSKRAVDRNRIKRVVRESFRINQQALEGLDLVVLPSRLAATICKHEMHASLEDLWTAIRQPKARGSKNHRRKKQ